MFTKKRKCPKCGRRRPANRFNCEWCDECIHEITDNIMRMIGYTVANCHRDLIDDAEETWDAAWRWAMSLPANYPDYAALCDVLSNICPVPGVN